MKQVMTSNRPYLIRAIYQWLCDNSLTVHLLVNAEFPGVEVPPEFVEDGQIVLNITPRAVQNFSLDQHWLTFSARFKGLSRQIVVPVNAVLAIFARENGEGMAFEPIPPSDTPPPDGNGGDAPSGKSGHLKVVK